MALSHGKAQGVEWGALRHRTINSRFLVLQHSRGIFFFLAVKSWIYVLQGGPGRLHVHGWVGVVGSGCGRSCTAVVVVSRVGVGRATKSKAFKLGAGGDFWGCIGCVMLGLMVAMVVRVNDDDADRQDDYGWDGDGRDDNVDRHEDADRLGDDVDCRDDDDDDRRGDVLLVLGGGWMLYNTRCTRKTPDTFSLLLSFLHDVLFV